VTTSEYPRPDHITGKRSSLGKKEIKEKRGRNAVTPEIQEKKEEKVPSTEGI